MFGLFHYYSSSLNVSVQVRRLVRRNLQRLVRSHFHRLFPFISQIVFVLPSVHPVTAVQHHSFSSSNVSVHPRRTLCGVGWNALLDPFFHFSVRKGRRGEKSSEKWSELAREGRSRPFWPEFSPFFRPGAVARPFLTHFSINSGCRCRFRAVV